MMNNYSNKSKSVQKVEKTVSLDCNNMRCFEGTTEE